MRIPAALAMFVLLAALGGCGGDDSAEPDRTPASSAGAPASVTDRPASASPSPGAVDELLHAALAPLLDGPVIDFRHEISSGGAVAVETRGRAFRHAGWEARTTSVQGSGGASPSSGPEGGSMQVRSVGEDLYLQLSSWQPPLAGCWLRTGPGQVPGGQLAMTPGVPGYVTLLGALQPEALVSRDGERAVIGAEVPLRVGLQLLTTGALGLLQLDASQLGDASVPVGVRVSGDRVDAVELLGSDVVSAVRAAGGEVPPDAEATLDQLRVRVAYRPGPADAVPVTAPDAGLVMTNADVTAERGCSAAAQNR